MSEENKKQEELLEKREARRKRRQRNQILAYLVVIVLVILLAVGVLALLHYIPERNQKVDPGTRATVQPTNEPEEESSDVAQAEETPEPEETIEPVETLEPVEVVPTYQEKLDEIVNAAIAVMPLEDKVAGLFMVTPELLTGMKPVNKAGESTRKALEKYAVGGILYKSQNVKNRDAFQTMLKNTEEYSKYPLFLAVEEEGGSATQIANLNIGTKTNSAKAIAATGDTQNAYQAGQAIGIYLKQLGLNMNLAPVADLANVDKSIMADRSYGSDAQTVIGYVKNAMQGLQDQGVVPCVKHFPGMGSVTTDTEKGVAVSQRSEEDFWASEMDLFHKLVDDKVPAIMISNMAAPSLTGDNTPCSLSDKVVTDILRKQLSFDGLIITDALNEKAVSEYYSSEQAAILTLKAGCDMIVCPENLEKAYQGVLKAVQDGTISEERVNDALRRIYRIKLADQVEE